MTTPGSLPLTVAIPTYGREAVLVNTVRQLLQQTPAAAEVLVLDQTERHEPTTESYLSGRSAEGCVRWIRFSPPSQPAALNRGLLESTQPYVLFLDDDIRIAPGFLTAHLAAFEDESIWAVAGQVLQPGETADHGPCEDSASGPFKDFDFRFCSAIKREIENGMSGNLSVRRHRALEIGGFDENFIPPVSFRFDNDFCKRLCRAGGRIIFEPAATIHHLRASHGGTRSAGNHLTSAAPVHGVGDYYFALRQPLCASTLGYVLRRPFREIRTRFHARHPWYIPVKLAGEMRAFLASILLVLRGPRLIQSDKQR